MDFQGVAYGLRRAVRGAGQGRHIAESRNQPVCADKRHRQGKKSILHPQADPLRLRESEQHALILLQTQAEHEAPAPALRSAGDFGLDGKLRSVQGFAGQVIKPDLVCQPAKQQQSQGKTGKAEAIGVTRAAQ